MAGRTGTVVVGGGQAGLALSRRLTRAGHDHVVLERGRVGERWRSERWASLALLTPGWANRLPGMAPPGGAHGFASKDAFAAALEAYADASGAPVLERTDVLGVERSGDGFAVRTSAGAWQARDVVVATGACDVPAVPRVRAPGRLRQLHASEHVAPDALAPGGVLVVGAGASGQQLAYELAAAGRRVVLAAGRHSRAVRRYRGRDLWCWLEELGALRDPAPGSGPRRPPEPSLPLDGRDGGRDLGLDVLAALGVDVRGRLLGFEGDHAVFDDGLPERVADAERRFRRLLARIDDHVATHALRGVPPAPALPAVALGPGSPRLPLAGISTVLWATGYRRDHSWVRIPVRTAAGEVVHRAGATPLPGLQVLGMPWQTRRTSHQIGGVGHDARVVADRILRRAAGRAHLTVPHAVASAGG